MSFKNNALDVATIGVQISETRNKYSRTKSLVFSIFLFCVSVIVLFFEWKVGLILMGFAIFIFIISRLGKWTSKANQETIEKLQQMKDSNSNERI